MEWKEVYIKDICTVLGDGLHGTPEYDEKGDFYFINGNNLQEGHITIKKDTKRVSQKEFLKYQKELNDRTILVSINGTIGNVAKYNNEPCILGKSACFFNVKEDIDRNFIYYVISSPHFKKSIIQQATGTTIKNVSLKQMRDYHFLIPVNLSDQRKIAGILSALDSKIENNNKINANLEAQAEALFKSWFVDFTPFKDQPFVDSELGPIPQGWKVGKLGDYCEVKSGYAFKSSWWTNKGYKIIKIKNISENGDINLNDCSCVLPENCDKVKNFIANTGDIVIAMTGATIGKFNIIPKIDEKFYINQRVGKFFLGEKPIEKVPYIYCFLKQENISTQIIQKGQGSAQPNISGADIESIPMLTPMSIILKYNKMCQPLFEKILSNRLESKKLSALRDTLLPKLMSGEIKL